MWLGRGLNTDQKGLRHQNKIQDSGIKTYLCNLSNIKCFSFLFDIFKINEDLE